MCHGLVIQCIITNVSYLSSNISSPAESDEFAISEKIKRKRELICALKYVMPSKIYLPSYFHVLFP